ncbi:MAG: RagB/SusD family nutrient uptake outer membrane protein [Bacteroidales bacterium]|jgi:hypothetical protein|nr:RagB/SusD family nutrient uptake outer membrane protein [Bacteroidales bacterium]
MKKYMLKKSLQLLSFCWLMAVCSCSDVLDSAPDGKISLDEIFADHEKAGAYLNSTYSYLAGGGISTYFYVRAPALWTDDAWDADAEGLPSHTSGSLYSGNVSAERHPAIGNVTPYVEYGNGNYWVNYWAGIRKATLFLNRIGKATVESEAYRSRWTAEAHLLRAHYYAELLGWFGCPLPIERETYSYTQDFSTLERSSYYEVVQFILEDCDAALNSSDLPVRITSGAEEYRFTKALAEAIKSRMSLYMASPLYNGGENHWEEAYQINKTALQNLRDYGYRLYDQVNFPQVWADQYAFLPHPKSQVYNEYFCNNMEFSADPVDKETIYRTFRSNSLYGVDGVGAQNQYKTGTCPSQELVDSYETIDGEPILDSAKPYLDEVTHLQPNFNPAANYDDQNPYVNRDPRFYASVYYNGQSRRCYWPFAETTGSPENYPAQMGFRTRVIATWEGEPQTGIDPAVRFKTRTGYYQRKFLHPFAGQDYSAAAVHHKSHRLGEVILNFAEAAAEAGHLDEAIAAVDEIRARAGMPPLPATLLSDKAGLLLRIHNERRVELALEGNRYYDVRRWHKPDEDLEKTDRWINAACITRNSDGSYTYRRGPVANGRACYTNKYLWAPLPMNDVNIMLALTGENWQNPGW